MFRCAVREPRGEKEGGKTVFYYGVVTELDLPTYGGRRSLHTQRRYSEFEALHAALSAAAGPRRLPPLPAKNPFAAFGGDKARAQATPKPPLMCLHAPSPNPTHGR